MVAGNSSTGHGPQAAPRRPHVTRRWTAAWRGLCAAASLVAMSAGACARDYVAGEVWSFKARAGEDSATLLIDKVESDPKLGAIYHISVSGVRVKNARAPGGFTTDFPHFPVSKAVLDESCIAQVGRAAPNPEFLEGHADWKRAFDRGAAGVFTIPVVDIIDLIESSLNP